MPLRLAVFCSHNGTNLQALLDACQQGRIDAVPAVVVGNNSKAYAFERARSADVPTVHLSGRTHPDPHDLDFATVEVLQGYGVDLVCLAGYLRRLGPGTVHAFRNRIVNIHPSLLPRHGGEGMHGLAVHQAVLDARDAETGASVILVDEQYDHGAVIAQERVPVLASDTADDLAARVFVVEHRLYPHTVDRIAHGALDLDAIADSAHVEATTMRP